MKIALTSVTVNNPVEAFKFYTEVLGFKEKLYMPEAKLAIVVSDDEPNGTSLLLEPNDNPLSKTFQEGIYKSGLTVIVFGTSDIQKSYEKLINLGVKFKKVPTKTQ